MLLSLTHHLVLARSCSFLCLSVNRSVMFSFQVPFHLIKFLPPFSTGVLSEIFLTQGAFFSIVRRQCVVDFIKHTLILSSSC